jgi:hypothetical protein
VNFTVRTHTADRRKFSLYAIFQRKTMPKGKFSSEIHINSTEETKDGVRTNERRVP